MHIRTRFVFASLCMTLACGPMIELEETSSDEGSTAPTQPPPMTTVAVTTVAVTTATTATTTGVTSLDSADVTDDGMESTGPQIWRDFPEYCSIIEQNCSPGYKCTPTSVDGGFWNDTTCIPIVRDPGTPGDPCTVAGRRQSGDDTCDETSMCWDVDPETGEGICTPFCVGTDREPTCTDQCDRCTLAADSVLALCLATCDPVLQTCGEGEGCYPINNTFSCATDASEDEMLGSACEFVNICPAGMACVAADSVPGCEGGSSGCCTAFCGLDGVDPCPGLLPGSTCMPFFEGRTEIPERCLSNPVGVCAQ